MVPVILFVPNIIGYTRIILAVVSLSYILNDPSTFLKLYTISYALDLVDGFAARMFKQGSLFGAQLDMVTDRLTSMLLFLTCCFRYQNGYFFIFYFIDAFGHWVHVSG